MTRTIVESKTRTAIIGFDQPFCVIGERINPTGRKKTVRWPSEAVVSKLEGSLRGCCQT